MLGAEEVIRPGCSTVRVTVIGVADQCLRRGRVERYESRFPELGLANGEDAVEEIDILGRQAAGFGEPQPGQDQQGEVRDIGRGWQSLMGQQAACLLQQRSHFRSGVDVGRRAAREASQEPGRGELQSPGRRARGVARTVAPASRRAPCAGLLGREDCAHSTASSIVTGPL